MKQSNIFLSGAAAIVAIIAVSGIALWSYAQDEGANNEPGQSGQRMIMRHGFNMTDEQKAEWEAKLQDKAAEREARRAAMDAAVKEGYQAWVEAAKEEMGEDNPLLNQINADNFSRFAEAHEHMSQARAVFSELGIERGWGKGGMKGMRGFKNCGR